MYPCRKCLNNNWKFRKEREILDNGTQNKWIVATCNFCGEDVEFGHKNIPHHFGQEKAEYKIKKGKRYLKIEGKFKEVYLKYKQDGSFKVTPIGE